jgi:DNA-binding response OmpR family regulator
MENAPKILIVDDEKDLCEILEFNLESEGYSIDVAYSGEDALKKPLEEYDLILLDVMMSGITGFKVANVIRKEKKLEVPIIFLTAKTDENDILTGFNVGADDYISKPFSVKEIIARIKAIMKRGTKTVNEESQISFKDLKINTKKKEITINGQIVNFTRKEYEILLLLMKNMGHYISREEILKNIWNYDVIVTDRNVDVNIARMRKKIGEYSENIKGKSGYGYCFANKE